MELNFDLLKEYYLTWQDSRKAGDLKKANIYYYATAGVIFDYLDNNGALDGDVSYDIYEFLLDVGSAEELALTIKNYKELRVGA